ncbi:hypothetical protein QUF72_16955 [Desulfobacterales bacterium HSG2]|nr:hypothetical protein [Desulfobacterales bacterium HSG2]
MSGILKRQGKLPTNTPAYLQAMGRQIAYRGPDDTRIVQEPAFGTKYLEEALDYELVCFRHEDYVAEGGL